MAWTYTLDGRSYHLKSGEMTPALGLRTGGAMSRVDTKLAVIHALNGLRKHMLTWKAGYRHLDCSPIYGNEIEVGQGLKEYLHSGLCSLREKLIHVTAFSPLGAPDLVYRRNDIITDRFVVEEAKQICKTPAQVLIRCGLQQGVSVILKSSKYDGILENQDVWTWEFCDETVQRLSSIEQSRQKVEYHYHETTSSYKCAADLWDGEV